MKKSWNRVLALLCVLALCVGLVPAAVAARPMGDEAVEAAPAAAPAPAPAKKAAPAEAQAELSDATHTIWVVGDSTVCHYGENEDKTYYYKRLGYGDMIETYLAANSGYAVKNIALSGRSSKSFVTDPDGGKAAYDDMIAKITTGDILIIGWGHNDEKSDDANRYTTVPGNWEVEGSFANSLWTRYVKPAQDKGATPIICTPIVRRDTSNAYSDTSSVVHYANGGSYAAAAIQLGRDKNVPVVDLTGLTKTKWMALGATENAKLHAWTSDSATSVDNTHLNKYGAKWVAYLLAKSILESEDAAITNGLKAVFSLDAGEPTATDLANAATAGWTRPAYTRPTTDSTNFTAYTFTNKKTSAEDKFKPTVFGTLGGAGNVTKGTMAVDKDAGSLRIAGPAGSKIASSNDGFSMYYYAIPAGSTFKMTATAIVNSLDNSDTQTGFGLMARDDMYIDTQNEVLSNYVVAGPLTRGTTNGTTNCFYRVDNALKNTGVYTSSMIKTGDVLELSLVKDSDGVTCAIAGQTPQSGGFDISLTAVDTEYMYVGPFANRKSDVTFSNLYLEINGEVICEERKVENTVTVAAAQNGTARANVAKAGAGMPIQLTATPSKGYVLDKWTVKDADNADVDVDGNLSFTMPAKAVTATPSFMAIPTSWNFAEATQVAAGKSAIWKGLSITGAFDTKTTAGKAAVAKDTVIRVPLAGSAKVTVNAAAAGKFTINGTPVDATSKTLSVLVESGKDGYAEIKAVDAGVLTGITVVPDSTIATHTITVTASPAGMGTATASVAAATEGTLVKLTAEPGSGYDFDGWTVTAGGVTVADNAFVMGNANVTITAAFKSGSRKVEIWDFAGAIMEGQPDGATYINRITPDLIVNRINFTKKGTDGKLTAASTVFGDLTVNYRTNDRIYSDASAALITALGGSTQHGKKYNNTDYKDGYVSVGGLYGNGAADSDTAFYAEVANVKAGDTLVAYAGEHQSNLGSVTFKWDGTGDAAGQAVEMTCTNREFKKLTLIAAKDGTYKFWNSASAKLDYSAAGKPQIQRVVRIPGVTVTGRLTLPSGVSVGSGWKLRFVNLDREMSYETAIAADGSYTLTLPVDVELTAQLSGATGYGIGSTGKVKTLTLANATASTPTAWNLNVTEQTTVTLNGTFTGFAQGYDLSKLKVVLTPEKTAGQDPVKVAATGNTFTATLVSDVKYTVTLEGANDYVVADASAIVLIGANGSKTITVQTKPTYTATGKFITLDPDDLFAPLQEGAKYPALPSSATVTALKFTNVEDNYEYTATVSNGGYTATLRDGAYLAAATVSGYTTKTHVVVDGGAVSKDLMFKATAAPAAVTYAADLYVNPKKADGTTTFKTVTAAVNYAARMTRSDTQRVTIHIAPGTYREQIDVNTKNITFVNDTPAKEVKITWYYGIGYKYYSSSGVPVTAEMDSKSNPGGGIYDPERAYDRYFMATADRWGCTIRLTAPGFLMENITLENSLNYYVTDEELLDGVTPSGVKDSKEVARNYKLDATSKAATERGAVLWASNNSGASDKAEFYNCKFLSSQDTIITGARMYFKNCLIEGMTDYICGPGDCVFDTCQLNWKGYSEIGGGGYITAPQTGASEKGYLFRNCAVTEDNDLEKGPGGWCRMWGGGNTGVTFLNTVLQNANVIQAEPWNDMGNGTAPSAATKLHEYGTKLADGTSVAPKGPDSTKMTEAQANAVDVKSYFGTGWTPVHFVEEDASALAFVTDPVITHNGDDNAPCYGTVYTATYSLGEANDANDISKIEWYRVAANGTETLITTSTANLSKSYRAVQADAGCRLKVTVTPATIGGKTAAAKSATMVNAIQNTYFDPDASGDVVIGDGINVFLAGDSTVKDYTASNENLGSWGEFLQAYLGNGVTVVDRANGGRSTRNFINEGTLKGIQDDIKAGDYLFIQFGHNDSSNISGSDYIASRYTPLGRPDANGKYPTYVGEKIDTPDAYKSKWGNTSYAWYSATYKGLLLEYVKVALDAGATPVLVTPVARMYYNTDGTIKPHHDESNAAPGTGDYLDASLDPASWPQNNNKSNQYCVAVEQLYEELLAGEHNTALGLTEAPEVLFIDGYKITEDLYKQAWKDCAAAGVSDAETYGNQIVNIATDGGIKTDTTHNNKLGGLIEAALFAQAIQDLDIDISKAVKAPAKVQADTLAVADYGKGEIAKGTSVFSVSGAGTLTAYDITTNYTARATYWEDWAAETFAAIAAKAEELNTPAVEEVKSMTATVTTDQGVQEVTLQITVKWTGEAEDDEDRDPADAADQEEIGTVTVNIKVPDEETIFAACWDEDGVFLGVKLLRGDVKKIALEAGWSKVKLIWAADGNVKPKCTYAEVNR